MPKVDDETAGSPEQEEQSWWRIWDLIVRFRDYVFGKKYPDEMERQWAEDEFNRSEEDEQPPLTEDE